MKIGIFFVQVNIIYNNKNFKEGFYMPVETAKDQICINQIIGQKTELVDIEGDVIVNDIKPDVLNIINVTRHS